MTSVCATPLAFFAQFRKIRQEQRQLRGTSFAQSKAMIVNSHQTDHQWPEELGRLSPACYKQSISQKEHQHYGR